MTMELSHRVAILAQTEASPAKDFLCHLLTFKSLSGHEAEAMEFVEEAFRELGYEIRRVPFARDFTEDPEYSWPIEGLSYIDRWNLIVSSTQDFPRTTICNTHIDVVPASKGHTRPFEPRVDGDVIAARGACDAKGQVAVLYLLARMMRSLGDMQKRGLSLHIVVEEENGGNGTLGIVRADAQGNEAIVLEPSRLRMLTTVRGAVWFRIVTKGRASHSGQAAKGISALNLAIQAKCILERYHEGLLMESVADHRFSEFANPMPLTFGRLVSGEWPAMTPDEAILEGVMGFLPNRTREQVMQEMRDVLMRDGNAELIANHDIAFMYKHDCHVVEPDAEVARRLLNAMTAAGVEPVIGSMPASCDSWYYNNMMGIPTVVFGAGDLAVAHTADEHIDFSQVVEASKVLAHLLCSE